MEDLKWLLRKCGLLILLLLIFVIVGVICWGKMHEEEQKVAEEVWEPPVEIENSEAETEEAENAETSTESAYWFIPQASDCLISDEEDVYKRQDTGYWYILSYTAGHKPLPVHFSRFRQFQIKHQSRNPRRVPPLSLGY